MKGMRISKLLAIKNIAADAKRLAVQKAVFIEEISPR